MDHNSFKSFAIQKKGSKNCKFTTRTLHIRLNSSDWKGLTERQKSFSKSSDILLNLFFIKKFVIFYVNFGKKKLYLYVRLDFGNSWWLFCFVFLNIAVKYLGKPRHWLIAEQSVLADAFTCIFICILQLEPHKTQIWSVFFLNDYPLRCECESSPCGNRYCIITFHKNSFWLKRTHGVDGRARTLESSENPGHLHNDCGASIHQEGKCREK